MATFPHNEQVEIVHKALLLETTLKVGKANIKFLENLSFGDLPPYEQVFPDTPPTPPKRKIFQLSEATAIPIPQPPLADYPILDHIKLHPVIPLLIILLGIASVTLLAISDSSVWMLLLGLLLGLASTACIIACPIMYFLEKKRRNTALANSPEYCNAVAQIQHENARIAQTEQARLDSQYNDDLTRYNTEVIPAYNKTVSLHKAEYSSMLANHNQEKKEWERERAETLRILEEDATKNEETLKNLYDSTNIISVHYREIPILEWLYDDMSTSDHDIRYATELLDRHRQRIATEEAKERTAHAIDGLSEAMKSGMNKIIQLQGIQIRGIQRMGAIASDILDVNEDIFAVSKKILFHERVNTADIVARNYRRAKAQKAR